MSTINQSRRLDVIFHLTGPAPPSYCCRRLSFFLCTVLRLCEPGSDAVIEGSSITRSIGGKDCKSATMQVIYDLVGLLLWNHSLFLTALIT